MIIGSVGRNGADAADGRRSDSTDLQNRHAVRHYMWVEKATTSTAFVGRACVRAQSAQITTKTRIARVIGPVKCKGW